MRPYPIITLFLLFAAIPVAVPAQDAPAGDSTATGGQETVTRIPVPELQTRWQALDGDSMLIAYAAPEGMQRPAVIVLGDRFGLQENVRSTVKVLAALGFRAYALPMRSAPVRPFTPTPAASVDTTDIARITRAAVDIANEPGCDGRLFLLAYDVGADVAIELIARFPFYKGAALFYPASGYAAVERLLDAQCRFQLHLAEHDEDCTMRDVNLVRDQAIDRGVRLHVFHYKDARRFFCNPEHPDYHKANTQKAWNQINKYFRYP